MPTARIIFLKQVAADDNKLRRMYNLLCHPGAKMIGSEVSGRIGKNSFVFRGYM